MKNRIWIFFFGTLLVLAFFFLWSRFAMSKKGISSQQSRDAGSVVAINTQDATIQKGAEIYQQKCAACHQINGEGISGTFPPLKGSDFLKTVTKSRIVKQIMNGSNNPMIVNGVTYNNSMPPQISNPSNAVAVANYILNSWGNNYGKVTLKDAQKVKPSKTNGKGMMRNGMMGRGMMMNR